MTTTTVTPTNSPSSGLDAQLAANSSAAVGKYRDYGVRLAPEHASALLKDEKIVLGPDQLSGGHILRLTPRQIAKFEKAKAAGKGVTLGKLSASQWKQNMADGAFYGDIWAATQKAAAAADKRHAKAIKQQGVRVPVKSRATKQPITLSLPAKATASTKAKPKAAKPQELRNIATFVNEQFPAQPPATKKPRAKSVKATGGGADAQAAKKKPSAPRQAIAAKLQGARAKKASVA
jgi:hypothetical protein